jgi:hypothetical protein
LHNRGVNYHAELNLFGYQLANWTAEGEDQRVDGFLDTVLTFKGRVLEQAKQCEGLQECALPGSGPAQTKAAKAQLRGCPTLGSTL